MLYFTFSVLQIIDAWCKEIVRRPSIVSCHTDILSVASCSLCAPGITGHVVAVYHAYVGHCHIAGLHLVTLCIVV